MAGTATDTGTSIRLLELVSGTVTPPEGAAKVSKTVQVVEESEFNEVEAQVSEDSSGIAITGIVTTLLTKSFCAMVNCAKGSEVRELSRSRDTWYRPTVPGIRAASTTLADKELTKAETDCPGVLLAGR